MNNQREIDFTTTPSKTRLNEGQVCYQGQLRHNQVLDVAETRRRFAEYTGQSEARTNYYLDALGAFMRERIAAGERADFGPFAMGLKLRGGFPAANAPFDERSNALAVMLTPGTALRQSVAALKPVNVTQESRSRITCAMQEVPPHADYDTIDASGTRQLYVATRDIRVHAGVEDEGIWLENDTGIRVLTGTVTASSCTSAYATFTDTVAPGLYWLVACGRLSDTGELLIARRRITAHV